MAAQRVCIIIISSSSSSSSSSTDSFFFRSKSNQSFQRCNRSGSWKFAGISRERYHKQAQQFKRKLVGR
eukprot:scaffold20343_cov129-Skeletonema_marinoi.AAC.2